jgi:tetratricopeptide (TPR) repeat protein
MVADAGRELRGRLGLKASPPEATSGARAAFPRGLEATKLYAQGTAQLRLLDSVAARDVLEQAASREPDNPLIETALASAWSALGYDSRAEAAVQKAFNGSGALNREDRLTVEGHLYEAQRQWARAVDVYRTLWGFFADNVEYGLRLADAQTSAGRGQDALATVAAMRRVAPPQSDDPRIDLAESRAQAALADFPRELAAIHRALAKASDTGSKQLLARGRLFEGRSYYNQGQPDAAKRSLVAARQMFIDAGDKAGAAAALNNLASVLSDQQDISTAQRMFEQSLAVSEEIGDRRGMSSALNNLGVLLKDQRRFVEARQAHERSLTLRKEIDDQGWTAVSLSNIGVVLFEQDQFREAAAYYKQSLAIGRTIGDKRGQVRALHNLAIVEREVGNVLAARAAFEESLATRSEIGDKRGGAMGRVELGVVLLAQGELGLARKTEEDAVRFAREARLKPGEAQALFQLGEIAVASGDLAAARGHHEQALALRREMKETRTVLESELALAELAFADGRIADAEREGRRLGHDLEGEASSPLRVAVELLTARTALARHDVDGASRALTMARRLAEHTERSDLRTALIMREADLDVARGRMSEARERLSGLRTIQKRSGLVLAELETRLLMLQIDRAQGRVSYRADASVLEKDAQARELGSIVRRVQAL